MLCPSCEHNNPPRAKFCLECGAQICQRCARCGTELPAAAKFCLECGLGAGTAATDRSPDAYTPKHLADKILAEQAALEAHREPEGERKTITALFADIKGSMELLEALDPEDARTVIDPALRLMIDAVHRYEGYVAQSMGDGIFALFGAPIAHEDHPQRALYAALLMQEGIRGYTERLRLEKGITIQVRIGLNTGEVVVRSIRKDDLHTDYVPIGHSTSLAARMESMATPGSIVASEHTQKLAEGYFQFKALGAAQVKGVTEPVEIYEVEGVGPLRTRLQVATRRGLLRFVGRSQELEQMRRAWDSARESRGQIVAVMGEAGVGKSRLVHEFKVPLASQCLVLEAVSVSHGKAYAHLPLIDLLKAYFQIAPQDDERKRREKMTGKVLTLDRKLEDTLPYLSLLLSIADPTSSLADMDAHIRRQRTLEAIKRLMLRESLNQPVILIFEDLHWIDSETQAFLEVLADSVATARILLLVNYRPEYRHGWASKTYYTRLRLDPLGREEAQELLTALVGNGAQADLQPLKKLILRETEGNPFFMEELVQGLVEEKALVGERGGYRLEKSPTEIRIPATVQGVLAARIDRLPPDEKQFLQTLSVIGKEFPFRLLREVVAKPEDDLYRLLSHVQAGEFIYEQPAFPDPEYTFKHALTQEVTYQSLLGERRKVLHERTAKALENLHQHRLDEHLGELAHHYGRTDNTRKAVEYLHLAGHQAAERSAYGEATSQLEKGLELVETLPESPERDQQELLLQITLGRALSVTQGFTAPEAENAYVRARQLCQQVGETPQLFTVLVGLWGFRVIRAEFDEAHELTEQLLGFSQPQHDPLLRATVDYVTGATLFFRGELSQARRHLEQVDTYFDARQHGSDVSLFGAFSGLAALSYLAWILWALGYPDEAIKKSREALTLGQDLSRPVDLAFVLFWAGDLCRVRGEPRSAQERAEAVISLSNEYGFSGWSGAGAFLRGCALAEQGQREDGVSQMRQALDTFRAAGNALGLGWGLGLLAEECRRSGQPEEGLALIAEGLEVHRRSGQRLWQSRLHRLNGELLLVTPGDNRAEAESCFRRSIDAARRQSARSFELEAATSLGRLWRQQGKRDEARHLLTEIYGWFTEGFDTRDLREAKALLDDLR